MLKIVCGIPVALSFIWIWITVHMFDAETISFGVAVLMLVMFTLVCILSVLGYFILLDHKENAHPDRESELGAQQNNLR